MTAARRTLLLLWIMFLAPQLLGAAPLPTTMDPATPVFGKVVTVEITLPADVVPAGLPALAPFVALAPPQLENGRYRLQLLPLGSGLATFPALPFRRGANSYLSSAPLTVEIRDDIPSDATIIPPSLPSRQLPLPGGLLLALGLLVGAGILLRVRGRSPVPLHPAPLAALEGDELLAELDRRLRDDDELPPAVRDDWRRRLDAARFSAPQSRRTTAQELFERYRHDHGGDA